MSNNNKRKLPDYNDGSREYYDALHSLSASDLKGEWIEIEEKDYWWLLECVPPIRHKANAFMVGECLTHTDVGAIYEAVCEVDGRFFKRPDVIGEFNPVAYKNEIRMLFNFNDSETKR